MSVNSEDRQRYESLYEEMLLRAMEIHENNKKRLRAGLIVLAVTPVVLIAVRALTDSDKVLFLILWIVFMFAICAYLIGVEYLDDSIRKTLEEVTREEVSFDDLYLRPDQLQEKLHEKAQERQELLQEHLEERQVLLQNKIEARQERFAKRRVKRQAFIAELRKRRAAEAADAGSNIGNAPAVGSDSGTAEAADAGAAYDIDAENSSGTGMTATASTATGNLAGIGNSVVDDGTAKATDVSTAEAANAGSNIANAPDGGAADDNYISKHAKKADTEGGAES